MESTAINTVYLLMCKTEKNFKYVDRVFADERKACENCEYMNKVYKDTGRFFWIDERIVF